LKGGEKVLTKVAGTSPAKGNGQSLWTMHEKEKRRKNQTGEKSVMGGPTGETIKQINKAASRTAK